MSHRSSAPALLCAAILAALSTAGCLGSREWTYPPPPGKAYLDVEVAQSHAAGLVVFPLEDQRDMMVREDAWKVAIPLVGYAVTAYDRPEEVPHPERINEVIFDPPRDFARAMADEIRHANIFSSVTFQAGDQPVPPDDFVLRGRLRSTRWSRALSAYLLGPIGTVAWMAGLPMGTVTTSVVLDLQLTSAGDPSRALWDFAMEFEGKVWNGVYYGQETSVMQYPRAIQEALRSALSDLADTLAPPASL